MSPNICFSRLARSTFCQRPIRFPPERCAFSPPRSFAGFRRPRNLIKLRVHRTAVNPLRSQDFHLFSTVCFLRSCGEFQPARSAGELFLQRVRKRSSARARRKNPAQAEAEDSSKIKDRLEALLFAETLQGTLSPNANPGKGSVGGLLN